MTVRRFASVGGALMVAAIAALASYAHMRTVALEYGQPTLIADLLPLSVDGMMAVATVALGDGRRSRWSAWLAFSIGVAASVLANVLAAEPSLVARCISAWPAIAFVLVVEVITRGGHNPAEPKPAVALPDVVVSAPAKTQATPRPAAVGRKKSAKTGRTDPRACRKASRAVPDNHPSRTRPPARHLRHQTAPNRPDRNFG
jgi:hypothetical protein